MVDTYPETRPLPLEYWYDEQEERGNDSGLDAKRLQGTILCRPWHLEVGNAESAQSTHKVDQCRYLPLQAGTQ